MIYKTDSGLRLSLNRGSANWFNQDCPPIYTDDGGFVVKNTLYGFEWDEYEVYKTKQEIANFVKKSYKAFCKKYTYQENPEWSKNDELFKTV